MSLSNSKHLLVSTLFLLASSNLLANTYSLQTIVALALPTNVPVLSTLVKKAWNCLGYQQWNFVLQDLGVPSATCMTYHIT